MMNVDVIKRYKENKEKIKFGEWRKFNESDRENILENITDQEVSIDIIVNIEESLRIKNLIYDDTSKKKQLEYLEKLLKNQNVEKTEIKNEIRKSAAILLLIKEKTMDNILQYNEKITNR